MRYEVLVVGGGHAGIEAAHAAARMGRRTALLTASAAAIGRMSCNPAIGGLAKGQLVREIDALGGLMGGLADAAGIQFRILNRSRGPAVWGPRAQCDRAKYASLARAALESTPGLEILEGMAESLLVHEDGDEATSRAAGVVVASGERIEADAVVITTGTFLNALMHTGERRTEGGRVGEAPSRGLSASLASLGIRLGRFKTGTPPRLHRDTIDYGACFPQEGDDPPVPFSFRTRRLVEKQALCWRTATNPAVHALIRENLHLSPMYSGAIAGIGPRYCPSVEDKVVKFADKAEHTIFLEPDGWESEEIYVNGLSTSLPEEVQRGILALIPGLTSARMIRPGYAVEYDFAFPDQLRPTLESCALPRLFLAGQINGTSGYEEAAAQGLVAGVNAALAVRGEEPFVLERSEAYAGVMIDDLTRLGLEEPYRLFTSRAEHRLLLGIDTVLPRLAPHGRRLGLISDAEHDAAMAGERGIGSALHALRGTRVNPSQEMRERLRAAVGIELDAPATLFQLLQRADVDPDAVAALEPGIFGELTREERSVVFSKVRYDGYIRREQERLERLKPFESRRIPSDFRYEGLPGLSREVVEKCGTRRPRTVGEAARIPGVTPAAVAIISAHVARAGAPQPPERFADILEERSRSLGLALPPLAGRLVARYLAELDVWRRRFNLTGQLSSEDLADHALEAVPASPLALIPENARVADIGSGAGFPAIPLAILRPDAGFTLFEPTVKKTTFLSHVIRELPLANARIESRRIEDARGATFPVATVRGVGSLGRHVGKAGFLDPGGRLLVWTTEPEKLARDLPRFRLVGEIPIPGSDRKRIAAFERLPAG